MSSGTDPGPVVPAPGGAGRDAPCGASARGGRGARGPDRGADAEGSARDPGASDVAESADVAPPGVGATVPGAGGTTTVAPTPDGGATDGGAGPADACTRAHTTAPTAAASAKRAHPHAATLLGARADAAASTPAAGAPAGSPGRVEMTAGPTADRLAGVYDPLFPSTRVTRSASGGGGRLRPPRWLGSLRDSHARTVSRCCVISVPSTASRYAATCLCVPSTPTWRAARSSTSANSAAVA